MEPTMTREYAKVIAKAWIDPTFKERLLQDPHAVLGEHGITLPEGMDFNSLQLPQAPFEQVGELQLGIHNCPAPAAMELGIHNCPAPAAMELGIHNCPAPSGFEHEAVTACPAPIAEALTPYDLIHDASLGVVACPAE